MDLHEHAQLIYTSLLQAWVTTHPGTIAEADRRSLAENAFAAAKTFREVIAEQREPTPPYDPEQGIGSPRPQVISSGRPPLSSRRRR